jgi:hypothetical protein
VGVVNGLTGLGSVPHRTSYELHLPAEMSAWYSAVGLQRTVGGRLTDAQRT